MKKKRKQNNERLTFKNGLRLTNRKKCGQK